MSFDPNGTSHLRKAWSAISGHTFVGDPCTMRNERCSFVSFASHAQS